MIVEFRSVYFGPVMVGCVNEIGRRGQNCIGNMRIRANAAGIYYGYILKIVERVLLRSRGARPSRINRLISFCENRARGDRNDSDTRVLI